jgi:tetratricopeptide (TPR) repeat protein
MREVKEILNDRALLLLKRLAIINPELECNINANVIKIIMGKTSDLLLNELIDTGMLSKKRERGDSYIFSYKHIQDILKDDKKDLHRWALNYYANKPSALGEGHANQIESLFHQSMIKPDKELIRAYLDLSQQTEPGQYGFKRLIDVGEQLKFHYRKDKPARALILGSIACSYRELKKFDEARKAFREAIRDYIELSREKRTTYRPFLSTSLANMAGLYKDLKKFDESKKAYKEALKIQKELANISPDAFMPNVAGILNNMANLYKVLRKFDESEKAYKEA